MNEYTFTHSVENTLDKPMCEGDVFLRPPNHLNIMLSDVGKLISFKNGTRGEDLDWSIQLAKINCLKLEYKSDPSRIHYIYNLKGHSVPLETLELQRRTNYETMLKMVWLDGGALPPKI